MKSIKKEIKNSLITLGILELSFFASLIVQEAFNTASLIPAIFVLSVFLTAFLTDGYVYGLVFSLCSVLAINFAFTFPFFKFNFSIPENIVSAVIMIIVTIITSTLTTKIKRQEAAKAEAELEKMRANLLRAISHDLRTPLTTIYGSSSAILENNVEFSEEQKLKMVNGIQEEADWLLRMVENLLSVTKIDTGGVELIKSPVVLDELIESVLLKFKKRYPKTPVELSIPDDFVTIPMDGILIEQVLINMLENSVLHAEGFTRIILHVTTEQDKAIFEIIDDGCGIPEDILKSIFTGAYHVGRATADNKRRNSGIGLSVCATIIRAHKGDITAENIKEGGAIFRFTLPMEEENEQQ